jgi:cell division protein FtsQ
MRLRPFLRRFRADVFSVFRFVAATAVVTGLVAGAVWGAYAELWPAVVSHSYFRLRSVKVVCDSPAEQPAQLAARAGLYEGTSLWQIDPGQARSALASLPWVRDARIFRVFPDQVALEVFRRDPVALTVIDGAMYFVDQEGVVFREGERVASLDLPFLSGWTAPADQADRAALLRAELSLVRSVESAGITVSEVHVDGDGTFRVYPEDRQLVIVLGRRADPEAAGARLSALWSTLPSSNDLREIDLSYTDRAVLRTAEGRTAAVISAMLGAQRVAAEAGRRG